MSYHPLGNYQWSFRIHWCKRRYKPKQIPGENFLSQFYLRMECINTSFSLDKQYISATCKQTGLSVINLRDRLKLQINVRQWRLKNIISVLSFNFGMWTLLIMELGMKMNICCTQRLQN